jgi:hypothetical protein
MTEEIEEWKDVVGYETLFRVSSLGRVYSKRTNKILRTVLHQTGYYVFSTRLAGRKSPAILLRIHRLVAQAFIPNPSNKPFVNHLDGVKTNNTPSNLEWATAKENSRHAWDNGLAETRKGEESTFSKLSLEQVIAIRNEYAAGGINMRDLGKKYGVVHSAISKIVNRVHWAHI